MRKLITLAAIFLGLYATAQKPAGMPAGMPGAAMGNAGRIYGKLQNDAGKPVPEASVILMQKKMDSTTKKVKDILLTATVTKSNGQFNLEALPVMGSLTLKISAVGFKAYETNVSFMPKMNGGAPGQNKAPAALPSFEKDLGNITLSTDTKELQGVTVVSSAAALKLSADKKVFNVEKNIMSTGGTGVDVMRNVPSVNVDIDGNITVRNAAPQLMVDGRPTTLTLDQIPADVIETVEVITNPSAKYDASGSGGGIINVVLKKNKKSGYNGNLRVGVDKRGAVNGGGDISLRDNKFNFTASLNANQMKGVTTGTTERNNLLTTPLTSVYQDNYNKNKGGFLFGKVGLDYFLTNRTTLSLSGFKVHGEFNPYESINITTDSLYNSGKVSNASQRTTTGTRAFNGQGLVFGMKQLFKKEGEELTVDANYFSGKSTGNSLYSTNYYGTSGALTGTALEKVIGDGHDKNFILQTDFVLPFSKNYKLETGVRAALRSRTNNTYNYVLNNSTGQYDLITSATNNYTNKDNVYAAYATLSNTIGNFSYKAGVRAESSDYTGTLLNSGDQFSNKYAVSLFPSLFLSQKLNNRQELQFSATRRVNRPNFFQLIPFTDYTDKLNITRGNPALKPEFTQSYELSYLKTYGTKNTFLASAYYKHSDNLITRYLTEEYNSTTGNNDIINSYINANSSYAVGTELTGINYLTKWWDLSTNVNIYNSKINTSNVSGATQQDAMWSWFGKLNNNFKLPANFSMQLTTTYQSKTNLPVNSNSGMGGPPQMSQSQSASQGYIKPSWGMDIAFKKSFLKNNAASVSFNISDIFRTRISSQYSYSDYFVQNYERLRDPQMFRINFSYRFGKIDMSLFKRKNNNGDQNAAESMQN